MQLDKTKIELNRFAERVVKISKLNLGKSVRGRKIDASGRLRNSISHKVDGASVSFSFEDYGIYVDAGVVGKKKKILKDWNKSLFKRGSGYSAKFPNITEIKKWIKNKPIKSRSENGRFVKQNTDSLAFLIGRKIYNEGKQPTLFFSDAWSKEFDADKITVAFADDMEDYLNEN